ncbi:MAG: hypothetical protein COS84_10060 [Armatimonadetes bacterium CG07_land_8_20_14_0_80_40_9]|nr:MAG: hypothetical protein COS84_10060 [Armatimonadetes bacterium CG07_land_8_20_14_0_80_40_9]
MEGDLKVKFSICNELFEDWKLEEIFRKVKEIGYQGIELAPFTLADTVKEISKEKRREIKGLAEDFELEIVGLHWLLVKPEGLHISHPEKKIREKTRDYLKQLIELCADLGGKVLVFGSPNQRSVLKGVTYQRAWEWTKEVFLDCLDLSSQSEVTLCMEPLYRASTNFINTAKEAMKFIKEINHPNLRLILDVYSMSDEEMPPGKIIRSARELLFHFHANDDNKRGPGFGKANYKKIFSALKEIDYKGYLSVEVFDFTPDPVTIAEESFSYLSRKEYETTGEPLI